MAGKDSTWTSAEADEEGRLGKLRREFRQSTNGVLGPVRVAMRDNTFSGRFVSLAELIADASSRPAGRAITAACALTGAWLLL